MGQYDTIGDLSDVEVRQPLLDAGTRVKLALVKAQLDEKAKEDQPRLVLGFEVVSGVHAGYNFEVGAGMGTTVGQGKKMSPFDATRRFTFTPLLLAIIPDRAKVNTYFRGCTTINEIVARVATLIGKPFEAELGVRQSAKGGIPLEQAREQGVAIYKNQEIAEYIPAATAEARAA